MQVTSRTVGQAQIDAILKVIDFINDWVGKVFSFLIIAVMCIMTFETVMRYIFHAPTIWASDTSWIIAGIYFLFGGAYAMRRGAHVNMDVVYKLFKPRVRATIDVFMALVFFLFCFILIYYGIPFASRSLMTHELTTPPSNLPVYFTKTALPVAVILMALQGLAKFARDFTIAFFGDRKGL
jgi:TRAP-type mannitol/chloroaromatic compound transport system permease small subunit